MLFCNKNKTKATLEVNENLFGLAPDTDAVTWRCSVKKVFLEILLNSQENT